MAFIGGDFTEVTFNHPQIGSGVFYPKTGEAGTLDLGGFRSDDEAESLAGNGQNIDIMKRKRWSFEITCAWDMNEQEDTDKLGQLAESTTPAEWTFTHISGAIYGATGKPVGDIAGDGGAGTFGLKVSGGGRAKKIS